MSGVIGRQEELSAIVRLLEAASDHFAGLMLEGEPGIGKTTIWREGVRLAEEGGVAVLVARPAEAERALSYAGLTDLLAPIPEELVEALPEPQRAALEVALLRRQPSGVAAHGRAVAAAVLSLLNLLADRSRVVVAIDDVQWLDADTQSALAFSLRRLADRPVAVLLAHRIGQEGVSDPLGLNGSTTDIERVRLGPVNLGTLYRLIRDRLGVAYPRPILQRIAHASGGNPMFALEMAGSLNDAGIAPRPGEALPIPETLQGLVAQRIGRLDSRTHRVLLTAALLADPTIERVQRAVGGSVTHAVRRAVRAGLIEVTDAKIRFVHPLFATVIASNTDEAERRAMHRKLARVVDDPEEEVLHLALGAARRSRRVADRLQEMAERAQARGAAQATAELLELSARLTPAEDVLTVQRRRLLLALNVLRAGDTGEAHRLLIELLDEVDAGPMRAEALELEARILHVAGTSIQAVARCDEAFGHAGDDPHLHARLHATRAIVEYEDFSLARDHARRALEYLEAASDPDPATYAETIQAVIAGEIELGGPIPMELVERGLAMEARAPDPIVADRLSAALGAMLKYDGQFEVAREWLERTHRQAIEEGDEGSLPYALSHLPQLELWTGRWEAAERWAREHLEIAERTHQPNQRLQACYNLALVLAHVGRTDEARRIAEDALRISTEAEDGWSISLLSSVLGFMHLSLGDAAEAVRHLATAAQIRRDAGTTAPRRLDEDYVEALVLIGDIATADAVARDFENRARARDQAMTLAPALRGRALVAAARGDLDGAVDALSEALAQHERVTMPFSLARTLLVQGQVLRRSGERRASREALHRALEIFRNLGAPLWARRAEAELGRIPIKRAASDGLTATEEQVAALAATGLTNRQIATELFMSPKTVEANLTRIYGKLGIGSRTALAAHLARQVREVD